MISLVHLRVFHRGSATGGGTTGGDSFDRGGFREGTAHTGGDTNFRKILIVLSARACFGKNL